MANGGTFCTFNRNAHGGGDPVQGNEDMFTNYRPRYGISGGSYYARVSYANFAVPSVGEWYWEIRMENTSYNGFGLKPIHGMSENSSHGGTSMIAYSKGYMQSQGAEHWYEGSNLYTSAYGSGIGAVYVNNGRVYFYHEDAVGYDFGDSRKYSSEGADGEYYFPTSQAQGAQTTKSNAYTFNFGQDSTFEGEITSGSGNYTDANGYGDFYYQPPGNALALCTANLAGNLNEAFDLNRDGHPNQHFDMITYTGNGGTQALSGLNFQPDLVWIKGTSGATNHAMFDSTRGTTKRLRPSGSAAAEDTISGVTAFNSDGFTLGSDGDCNTNSATYVAMCWKVGGGTTTNNTDGTITGGSTVQANQTAGFSIVKWTSDNTNGRTVGHGLSQAPEFIISKPYSASTWSWHVFHHYEGSVGKFNFQNGPLGGHSAGTGTYGANPTATVFNVGNTGNLHPNNTTTDVISYCWHTVRGFSKFGVYTGTGGSDADGNIFIPMDFKPKVFWLKKASGSSTTYGWPMFVDNDNFNDTSGMSKGNFWIDQSVAQSDNYNVKFHSNGVKCRSNNTNVDADQAAYIFGAWADVPTAYANAR